VAKVGDVIEAHNANWQFSGAASTNFDAHIRKSVPYYEAGHQLTLRLSDFFLQAHSLCYDLGCATGQLLAQMGQRHSGKNVRFVGLDSEFDMTRLATANCVAVPEISIEQADIVESELAPSDLIIAYYTLQFIPPRQRQGLFDRIYQSLNWGGGFILFEKVRAPDARFQDIMSALYTDYKLDQGYSGDEIVAKARSLKGVLEPFSSDGNRGLLQRAGFSDITTVFKYVCFEGFLAIK